MVSATLRKAGLKTAEAVNGRAAFDWLAGNPLPDLVLLDLMMPEMDGFQFLERLREQPDWLEAAGRGADRQGSDRRRERAFLAERTVLVLGKSAQPISTARHGAGSHRHAAAQRRQSPTASVNASI